MKKIVAILLAITLMSTLFIVPAHAQGSEGIMPRAPICVNCQQPLNYKTQEIRADREYYDYPGCTNNAMTYKHYDRHMESFYTCPSGCSESGTIDHSLYWIRNVCIYG